MPVRPIKQIRLVSYHFGFLDKNLLLPESVVQNINYVLEQSPKFNLLVSEMVAKIKIELTSGKFSSLEVSARTYKNIHEGNGFEIMTPRNYLAKEVLEIKVNGFSYIHFLGGYGSLDEARINIIKQILDKHGKCGEFGGTYKLSRKEKRGIYLDEQTIESVRVQFRFSKPKRHPRKIR